MKRKKTSEISNRGRPAKSTANYNEKTLLDFWKPKNEKKKTKSKLKQKSRSVSIEKENTENALGSKKHILVKNPSKQLLVAGNINTVSASLTMEYKRKILFNEELVRNLKSLLEPFVDHLKNAFIRCEASLCGIYNELSFNNFLDDNFESSITKFLMQNSDDFIFVPLSFTTKNGEGADKTKIKLFEGFNDSKFFSLQYQAANSQEILNSDLSKRLTNYLKHFNKKKSRRAESKAFVIFDDRYIELVKTIETICNDRDYKILKLDELENAKINKLNKISEALQSQRLSSLPELLSERLKVLDKIVNNESQKLLFMLNGINDVSYTERSSNSNNFSNNNFSLLQTQSHVHTADSTKSTAPITHWFQQDTKERTLYKTIEDNIYQICAKKKTLILIVDSFSHHEEDRNYFNSILDRISSSKCPIVILTKSGENFYSSSRSNSGTSLFTLMKETTKSYKEKFSFYQTAKSDEFKIKTYYLVSLILLLQCVVEEKFDFYQDRNADGSLDANLLFSCIKDSLTCEFSKELEVQGVYDNLVNIAYKISLELQWDADAIFFTLFEELRKNKHYNYKEKIKHLNALYNPNVTRKVLRKYEEYKEEEPEILIDLCESSNTDSNLSVSDESKNSQNNFCSYQSLLNANGAVEKDSLKKIVKMTERFSFQDAMDARITKQANRKYNYFYFSCHENNKKIIKDVTLNKKDPHLFKNNEQLVNVEKNLLLKLANLPQHYNDKNNFTLLYENSVSNLHSYLKDLLREDCQFYKSLLLNKVVHLHKRNLYEWNYLLKKINIMDYESFLTLFGIRKPRSTRKIQKEKESSEETKLTALHKVFNKSLSLKLVERFINSHSASFVIQNFDHLNFVGDRSDSKYYTGYRTYEEIKQSESQIMSENEYSSIDEESYSFYISEDD